MNTDLTLPLDIEPATASDLKKLRINVRISRFINKFLETGSAEATALALNVSKTYVMEMLKSPLVRNMLQQELNISMLASRVNRARLIMRLYDHLMLPTTTASEACKLAETISKLSEVNTLTPNKLEKTIATVISYDLIDNINTGDNQ